MHLLFALRSISRKNHVLQLVHVPQTLLRLDYVHYLHCVLTCIPASLLSEKKGRWTVLHVMSFPSANQSGIKMI